MSVTLSLHFALPRPGSEGSIAMIHQVAYMTTVSLHQCHLPVYSQPVVSLQGQMRYSHAARDLMQICDLMQIALKSAGIALTGFNSSQGTGHEPYACHPQPFHAHLAKAASNGTTQEDLAPDAHHQKAQDKAQ